MTKTGIILAGGEGTRLKPMTEYYSKSLINIGGKFVIDYPLQTLLQLGVKDLIVVLGSSHFEQIVSYIKDGKQLGFNSVCYVYQGKAEGISQAIYLCQNFINEEEFYVILGDNVFSDPIRFDETGRYGAQVALHSSKELQRFGVASLDELRIVKIEEKPKVLNEKYRNMAISGLYRFDQDFFHFFKNTSKSDRGEFEITDILLQYLKEGSLGYSITHGLWQDAGTISAIQSLNELLGKK